MSGAISSSQVADLTSTTWRDETFFQQFALNQHTVLEYFSRSPFYVPQCNNEECKRQGLPISMLHTMKPGVEFVLATVQEPVLYVIKRQYRESPSSTQQQAFYYVLFGTIYMAPSLHAALKARVARCLHNLQSSFSQLKRDLEPLGWKERQRAKRIRAAAQQASSGAGAGPESAAAPDGGQADRSDAAAVQSRDDAGDAQDAGEPLVAEQPLDHKRLRWIQQTDTVILNVLGRYAVPMYGSADTSGAVLEVTPNDKEEALGAGDTDAPGAGATEAPVALDVKTE